MAKGNESSRDYPIEYLLSVVVVICLVSFYVNWMKDANSLTQYILVEDGEDPAASLFVFDSFYVPDYTYNSRLLLSEFILQEDLIKTQTKANNDDILQPVSDKIDRLCLKEDNEDKDIKIITDSLRKGETLFSCLKRHNISNHIISKVIAQLKTVINVRRLRPGEKFELYLDSKGLLLSLKWFKSELDIFNVKLCDKSNIRYKVFVEDVILEKRILKASGKITDDLINSFLNFGLRAKLARNFADIFASQIDFNTDIKHGDSFKLIYEEYRKNGKFVGLGRILAAEYCFGDGPCLSAFYFKGKNMQQGAYFTANGKIIGGAFLRSPLKVYRITSGFTPRRLHPMLKVVRPHYGVDLAAPIGTPVMAVADGIVTFTGWQRGYGRIVIIKHEGGYKTYYGHLSRFARGIRKGVTVRQKQVIGYVGRSGYATGPHLDYRVKKGNKFVDPFRVRINVAQNLSKEDKREFLNTAKSFQKIFNDFKINGIISVKKEVFKGNLRDIMG